MFEDENEDDDEDENGNAGQFKGAMSESRYLVFYLFRNIYN